MKRNIYIDRLYLKVSLYHCLQAFPDVEHKIYL